jgi:hypothetical protein
MANKPAVSTYSSTLRDLRKNHPEQVEPFMIFFKEAFVKAVESNLENLEEAALLEAHQKTKLEIKSSEETRHFLKIAADSLELGEPETTGKNIATVVKFLIKKISPEKRSKSLANLREKIWYLNEYDMAAKKTPSSASLGQSITFIKTVLNGNASNYIRSVLNFIVRNLY